MRSWILFATCAAAAITLAGFAIGQEGPVRDSGPTVARPRRPADAESKPDLPKLPSQLKKPNNVDTGELPTFSSDVDLVTVDVSIVDNKGHFIPGIPAGNFRLLEDNVPQKIEKVDPKSDAPMTVALLIEFSNLYQSFWGPAWQQTLELAFGFASTLKPQDYCAVIAYDIKPEILTDFTTDRQKISEALNRLQIASWSESNLFDAVTDTANRMSGIEGRKAIVLISTGVDTFSKLTFDKTRKSLQQSGVPVYSIGLMQALRILAEPYMGAMQRMDFYQADNQLRTFSDETGGQAFFPRFEGEFPEIFNAVARALRSQYVVTYAPSNKAHDGTFRKIKVELVNPATNQPLPARDEKGKPVKYKIVAKSGYRAPRAVE